MKKKYLRVLAVLGMIFLLGCGGQTALQEGTEEATKEATEESMEEYLVDFSVNQSANRFACADGYSNGSMFHCIWRNANCTFKDEKMQLTIDMDGDGTGKIPYSGAEYRSMDFYGYGHYEVRMKPIKNDGVVSSFFTYTGPSDNNPWDEIDIEFLGKNTTCVQFNYFTDGIGNHEFVYDLGFDASEEFHTYGFTWSENKITWYVDGEAVHEATENIPTTPGKIMANVWPGTGVDGWLGKYDGTTPLTAEYQYIDYTEENLCSIKM